MKQQNLYDFEQESAKSNKRKIVINGRKFESLESAARAFGVHRNTLDYRLSKGWTPEEAVGLEPRPNHAANTPGVAVKVLGREFKNIKAAAEYYNRSYGHVIQRLKDGCKIEEALGLDPLTGQPKKPPLKRHDTLQSELPELAKEWHPKKNGNLTPNDVTLRSDKKVWWLCQNGHEWEAIVKNRTRGAGCPSCAGLNPTADNNFATEYPEMLKEWDWEKNSKKPEDFTPRSNSKVWWKCEKGHSWKASIQNRTRATKKSCPCCSNRKLCEDNSLAQVRPDIAKDWHPTKNAPLTPNDVVAGGGKKVWWICKHGHEWKTAIAARVSRGTGCPMCSLQTSRIEIAVYSEISALFDGVEWRKKISGFECDIYLRDLNIGIEVDGVYWHGRYPERELKKSKVFNKEGIQLYRLREEGLSLLTERDISFKSSESEFVVISRLVSSLLKYAQLSKEQRSKLIDYINGSELINEKMYRKIVANLPAPPPGESLADKNPEIASELAYDLNAPLSPEHFRPQASKNVWWRCKNGHIWQATMNTRVGQGTGCPHCPRPFIRRSTDEHNLAAVNPELASEWHPEKNGDLRPEDVAPKSNEKVWWQCKKKKEHEWEATIGARTEGTGCPFCYGRYATEENNLAAKFPELLNEWDYEKNKGINPAELTPHVSKKVWWKCKKGHSYQAYISNRTRHNSGCATCAKEARKKYSIEYFQDFAKEHGGECLSNEYKNCKTKLKFRCKEGHTWETRADNILYDNKWCSECAKNAVM